MAELQSSTRLAADSPPAQATYVRWGILLLLMAFAGLCHFNRISISVAGTEHIMEDYDLTDDQMGMVYSSYLFVYTLCMVPGGWLIDRIGPKRSLLLLGYGSAILVPMTGLTSYASAGTILLALCAVRALLGVVSAPMHPGAARAVSFWMPVYGRGAANGLVTGAAVAGIAATYYVFGKLMDLVGWPAAFVVAGGVTLLLALVWQLYATDHPGQHRGANERERELIEPIAGNPFAPRAPGVASDPSGLWALFRNRSLVMLTLSYAAYSYVQYLFFYWTQHYFDKVLQFDTDTSRLYTTIVMIGMAVGMIGGGGLGDRAIARFGRRWGRALAPMAGMTASTVLLILAVLSTREAVVVGCFTLAMAALGASESSFWVTGIELGRHNGGLSGAFLNAGGNLGGIPAPYLTPLISGFVSARLGEQAGWGVGLVLAGLLCLVGAVLWCWVTPDEPA